MKRLFILSFLVLPIIGFGQHTMKDFMAESCDVVWFGLDFTQAKMIGSEGFNDPVAIKEDYFRKWNHLMINEGEKYDWQKALVVTDLKYDYEVVDKVNETVKVKSLVINKSHSVYDDDIASAIKRYEINDFKDAIGVVVVVESFNKIKEHGTGYIVFFDLDSREVLYSHKLIGEAGGFGFRNYWAGAIHNWLKYTKGAVMKDIRKKYK